MNKKIYKKKIKFLLLLSSLFFANLTRLEAMASEGFEEMAEKGSEARKSPTHRLYVVVDEKLEKGLFANVIAHTAVGLGSFIGTEPLEQVPYISQDGEIFNGISRHPFIILKGKSTKIRELWKSLKDAEDIKYVSFTDTMHLGPTAEDQIEATHQRGVEDLKILGISLFGAVEKLLPLMRRFPLYK